MATVAMLDTLLATRTLWHAGRNPGSNTEGEPTGHGALDALLPQGGWPRRALTELLLPAEGIGELSLLLPTLARCTQAGAEVAVIAPPCLPYAPAWQAAGVDLSRLQVIEAAPRDALWAFEQCLRSGACEAVVGWPLQADARALRRLQVAADSGHCLGFALRDRKHAANPSPAALRLEAVRDARHGTTWRVRKCRGGAVPSQPFVQGDAHSGSGLPPCTFDMLPREAEKGGASSIEASGGVHVCGHADRSDTRPIPGTTERADVASASPVASGFGFSPSPAREGGGLGWRERRKAPALQKRNGTLDLRCVEGAAPLPRG